MSAGRGGALQEIADWLEKLGLGQYAQRFAENEIDISVLPHLRDQDLKDIGVPLGHRRKILVAIELAGAARATPEPTVRTEPKPPDTAERRQVTVMFSDLVGSTAMSARMGGTGVLLEALGVPLDLKIITPPKKWSPHPLRA